MMIEEIFDEYEKKKESLSVSIKKMKDDLGDMVDRIVLYGAGSAGIAFLHYLRDVDIYPKFFADGNPDRWGTICEDIPVIDYHEIVKKLGDRALVIVTINTDGEKYCKSFDEALRAQGHTGVHRNLAEAGCRNVIDYTYFRRCRDLFHGDRYNLPSCSDVSEMEQHRSELCEAYELLEDEKSRDVFEKIVRFRLLDDTIRIPTESQDRQYFEYEFFQKRDDEIFVDCGAYNGISLKTLLRENNNKFQKYYGLEPDPNSFDKLKAYVSTLPTDIRERIELSELAVYDSVGDRMLYSLNGPGSFIADIGNKIIHTTTIDRLNRDGGVTFIKMNIEGSEIPAINGAEQTIRCFKPRLAIAGYHKTRDLWEIPMMIHRMNERYRFHLRSYMNHISFIYYIA